MTRISDLLMISSIVATPLFLTRCKMRRMKRIPLEKLHITWLRINKEIGENVTHVGSTFSGIELVHFCTNENTCSFWEELKEGQKLGVVVFWKFVVDVVLEAMKHIGCQYLFLFAADKSEDEELVAYYRDRLSFKEAIDMATAKPIYDLTCKFMYQETCSLESERDYFFEHYNIDSEEA